jgi:hypothetical protein
MLNGIPMWDKNILDMTGAGDINVETLNRDLAGHLVLFARHLGRKEHRVHLATLVRGRMSNLARKSGFGGQWNRNYR